MAVVEGGASDTGAAGGRGGWGAAAYDGS